MTSPDFTTVYNNLAEIQELLDKLHLIQTEIQLALRSMP